MIKVILLGGGNVAHHLARVFINSAEITLIQVFNRNLNAIKYLKKEVEITNSYSCIKKADIYMISVSDSAIEEVSSNITNKNALIVHTSGSTSLKVLKQHKRTGVFYPLQTFSKNSLLDFNEIPICIEASNKNDLKKLKNLAQIISKKIYTINSVQREQLHIAAVFVNNFVNHLYTIGEDICNENNIQPDILQPLIKETAKKIENLKPFKAQTGPARRGDYNIIEKHLSKLNKNKQEIYRLLSNSIASKYGKKL